MSMDECKLVLSAIELKEIEPFNIYLLIGEVKAYYWIKEQIEVLYIHGSICTIT